MSLDATQLVGESLDHLDSDLSIQLVQIAKDLTLNGWNAVSLDVNSLPSLVGVPPPYPWVLSSGNSNSHSAREAFVNSIPSLGFMRKLYVRGWFLHNDVFWTFCCLEKKDPTVRSQLLQSDYKMFGADPVAFEVFRLGGLLTHFQAASDNIRDMIGSIHAELAAGIGVTDREPVLDRDYLIRGKRIHLRLKEGVFAPSRTTQLFARNIEVHSGESFFEVGFGSLLLSILAAKLGASSLKGSEMDDNAVDLAEYNARQNGLEEFDFMKADMFPDDIEPQDVIVGNVPQTPSLDDTDNIHIDAGPDGTDLVLDFIARAMGNLAPDGRIYVCVASIANADRVLGFIDDCQFEAMPLESQELPIPSYVVDRLESPHFKFLVDKGDIFLKDEKWHSRDTLYELRRVVE